ncbi:hypothetical protein [Salipiger aestuarii]|uniref:hypothetical protein n=1 Tax=Salipiger aestuarii TaxID=568098 RepID=UPI0011B94A3D|nr:hypothetical protein [Salipiger aestuarii]
MGKFCTGHPGVKKRLQKQSGLKVLRGYEKIFSAITTSCDFAAFSGTLTNSLESKGNSALTRFCPQSFPQKWWIEIHLNSGAPGCSKAGRIEPPPG